MTARFHVDLLLATGASIRLPDATARHVQVLRLQPGEHITLFNGQGDSLGSGLGSGQPDSEGEFDCVVERMGRSEVEVRVGAYTATCREAPRAMHLAVGMPANDRMDWLVEKATELGAASIQPLMTERSVLRLKAERAEKKVAHWRGIATASSEQCGRNRVPVIHDVMALADWLKKLPPAANADTRLLLSLQGGARPLQKAVASAAPGGFIFLSGPEGGISPAEEADALACGFGPVTLGPRVLRADTAPLACLAWWALQSA